MGTSHPTTRGSAGGRANEAGSSYRAGLAAYLAAHSLADSGVRIGDGAEPGWPASMWFETPSAVDDLRCRFTTGWRWDIQAKRTCSWSAVFTRVVEQWVEYVRTDALADRDRVVLASRNLSGPLKVLGEAFRRLREAPRGTLLPQEDREYRRFRQKASDEGWLDELDEVVAHALILNLAAETESDSAFREAAALLDGTVVSRGAGLSAVNALARFFQTEAARAGTSGPEQWLRVLDDARIEAGPASAQASAGRIRALANYRQALTSRLDLLKVDHLAAGVQAMPVPDLLNTFRVELPTTEGSRQPDTVSLARVARRWPRVAVIGLPGSGKSTALEQLAAAWAADLDAPLPIVVRLHRLGTALRDHEHLEIEDVVRFGSAVTVDLAPLLAERLRDGTAALLLDGLDECRDQQGTAASLVRRLSSQLHPDSGLVMSARDAASEAARTTGLPLTVLQEPQHLDDLIGKLVAHVFEDVRPDAEAGDVRRAQAWVEESRSAHDDIWGIPLFAILLAVHAAQTPIDRLPTTRSAALVTAINDSVKRWERNKAHEPSAWQPELHPDLLLDGFADIGHAIVSGDTDVDAAAKAIARTAMSKWGDAPNRAAAVAADVMRWWLDRVGVFTVTDGLLQARVRLMGEVADAMWAARQTPKDRAEWVRHAVAHVDLYKEPALLAATLRPEVAEEIIEIATEPDAILLAADAVVQGAAPRQRALICLVDHLARLAVDHPPLARDSSSAGGVTELLARIGDAQQRRDGAAWAYILALARLPLPIALRSGRNLTLDSIESDERRVVATALAAIADCTYDQRDPQDHERELLESVLALPVPEREPATFRRSRRHLSVSASEPILSGRAEAVTSAIGIVGLSDRTAEAAGRLAQLVSWRSAVLLRTAMIRAGFADVAMDTDPLNGLGMKFGQLHEDHGRVEQFILQVAAETPCDTSARQEPMRPWRLTGAAAVFEILEVGKHTPGTSSHAVDDFPDLVRNLVDLAIRVSRIPPDVIAEDARRALELYNRDPLDTALMLYLAPEPFQAVSLPGPELTTDTLALLRSCVLSGNDWLFGVGAEWLVNGGTAETLELLWETLPNLVPLHRLALAGWLAEGAGRDHVYASWLTGDDTILRLVAARAIATIATDEETVLALAGDRDLLIRLETLSGLAEANHNVLRERATAAAAADTPSVWTCRWCGSIESMDVWDCTSCTTGDRPDLNEAIRHVGRRGAATS